MHSQLAVSLPRTDWVSRKIPAAMTSANTAQKNWRTDKPKKMVSLCLRTSLGIFTSIMVHLCFENFTIYIPNISRTNRLEPLTNPVRIIMLNASCPMYCHTIVTADSEVSTAGLLLDRNAE